MSCFRNICGWMWSVYYGDPVEPPASPTYCRQTAQIDAVYTSDLNGADMTQPQVAAQLAGAGTYFNFEGVVGTVGSVRYDGGTQTWNIQVWHPATEAPFATLGLYTDVFDPENPVIIPIDPTNYECVPQTCYRAVFTPNDVTLTEMTSITVNGLTFDLTFAGIFMPNFATMTANDFDGEFSNTIGAYFDPDYSFEISINGNEVTITICSALEVTSGSWGNWSSGGGGGNSGNFNFTAI